MSAPRPLGRLGLPTIPEGEIVASFPSYEQARAAVDALVREEGFSVSSVSIVGSDLKSVERVTGRMSYGRAALGGLANGLMIGLFMSLAWLVLVPSTDLRALLGVFIMALAFGVIWNLLAYSLSRQKKEFTSMMQVTASRFDVIVPRELGQQVRSILERGGTRTVSGPYAGHDGGAAAPAPSAPPMQGGLPPAAGGPAPGSGEPEAPTQPPRTYGEMQDELRRRRREEAEACSGGPRTGAASTNHGSPDGHGSPESGAPDRGSPDRGSLDGGAPEDDARG
ncbi:general stress protein [Gulosibacter sp. 10]|uniref:general stress protein n=1 Tax=Gulosibacter sp. 10 TaxID=1255570 RepID=UPI00097F1B7A|nr:general stress protein [Gulosibacter sp. 10]SJM56821.1 hypothetical protein FM112_04870 [Gulosibacter sp. 10]